MSNGELCANEDCNGPAPFDSEFCIKCLAAGFFPLTVQPELKPRTCPCCKKGKLKEWVDSDNLFLRCDRCKSRIELTIAAELHAEIEDLKEKLERINLVINGPGSMAEYSNCAQINQDKVGMVEWTFIEIRKVLSKGGFN